MLEIRTFLNSISDWNAEPLVTEPFASVCAVAESDQIRF
jgi:hypothetical protein